MQIQAFICKLTYKYKNPEEKFQQLHIAASPMDSYVVLFRLVRTGSVLC